MPKHDIAAPLFKVEDAPLSGLSLIEASAGSGKTYAIANLYLRLVLEADLSPESILAVTFTEAATGELRDRVRRRLAEALAACRDAGAEGDAALQTLLSRGAELCGGWSQAAKRLSRALRSFDQAAIFTIHGFCARTLAENSFECGTPFDAELIEEQDSLLEEMLADFRRLNSDPALKCAAFDFAGLDGGSLLSFAKSLLLNPDVSLDPAEPVAAFAEVEAAFNAAMDIWLAGGRGEVERILLGHPGLSRAKEMYAPSRIPLTLSLIDMAAAGAPAKEGLAEMAKLAAGRIKTLRGSPEPEHGFFKASAKLIESLEGFGVSVKLELAAYLRRELELRKASWNRMCYDDLLSRMRDGLRAEDGALGEAVRKKYKAAMIDEFQDTDPVQLEIFMRAFKRDASTLLLIGDPKQSIYRFRGADVFSYLKAAAGTPPDRKFTLAENWRSETRLVEALNMLFEGCPDPFALGDRLKYIVARAAAGSKGNGSPLTLDGEPVPPLRFMLVPPGGDGGKPVSKELALEASLEWAVAEAAELIKLGTEGRAKLGSASLKASDIAMLVLRNSDAEWLRGRLGALGIPAALQKAGDVLKSKEATEVLAVLEAVFSPGDARRLNAALLTDIVGVGPEALRLMLEEPSRQADYEEFLESFRRKRREWEEEGFSAMFRRLLVESRAGPRLMERRGGERSLTNILHVAETLQSEASKAGLGPERLVAWLAGKVLAEGGDGSEERELRLERDDEAVKIVTVHKSKGLEYGVVICPALWQRGAALKGDEDFKYHKSDGGLTMDIGSPGREGEPLEKARVEELSDLMRLLYVALTRARSLCALSWGRISHCESSSLAHLLHNKAPHGEYSVASLCETVRRMDAGKLAEDLAKLDGGKGLIEIRAPALASPCEEPGGPAQRLAKLFHETFSGHIRRDLGTASFSMLSANSDEDLRFDSGGAQSASAESPLPAPSKASGIFAFPKGAVAGTCLHQIFERLDFSADAGAIRKIARGAILEFGLSGDGEDSLAERTEAVAEMAGNVLGAGLLPGMDGFRLDSVAPDRRVSELEFHVPAGRLSPEGLKSLFEKSPWPGATKDFAERLGRLDFSVVEGFLHGYIDLAFEHGGRHWIVDWKSNHLGNSIEDYGPESLRADMEGSLYILQYCIYAAAWTRHLKSRLPDFDYERDFGGVLYVYLRGVTKGRPGWGVHFAKPPLEIVQGICGGSL